MCHSLVYPPDISVQKNHVDPLLNFAVKKGIQNNLLIK